MSEMVRRVIVELHTGKLRGDSIEDTARRAIVVLRRPTQTMSYAGCEAAFDRLEGAILPSIESAAATWRAMIDAALSDE